MEGNGEDSRVFRMRPRFTVIWKKVLMILPLGLFLWVRDVLWKSPYVYCREKKCVAQHIHDFFLMTERNDGNITENYLSSLQTHWAIWIFLKVPGLPWWLKGLRICLQCGTPGFDPWVRKILWRRKWQLAPIFLPGKFHGPRSLVGPSPWSHKDWTRLSVWNFHFHFNTFWSDSKPSP